MLLPLRWPVCDTRTSCGISTSSPSRGCRTSTPLGIADQLLVLGPRPLPSSGIRRVAALGSFAEEGLSLSRNPIPISQPIRPLSPKARPILWARHAARRRHERACPIRPPTEDDTALPRTSGPPERSTSRCPSRRCAGTRRHGVEVISQPDGTGLTRSIIAEACARAWIADAGFTEDAGHPLPVAP